MNLQEYKKSIILSKQSDAKTLAQAGVLSILPRLLKLIEEDRQYDYMYIIDYINHNEKDKFDEAFENLIPDKVWNDKSLAKQVVDILYKKAKNTTKSEKQIFPEGKIEPEINEYNQYDPSNRSIRDSSDLFRMLRDANPDKNAQQGFAQKQSENYVSVLFKPVDFDIRTAYFANFSTNSYVHIAYPNSFHDSLMGTYANKYVKSDDSGRNIVVREEGSKLAKAVESVHKYYAKAQEKIPVTSLNALAIVRAIENTTKEIRKITNRDSDPPLILTLAGQTYVYDLMDVYHVLVAMFSLSSDDTKNLDVKIFPDGEMFVYCNLPVLNMEGKDEVSFGVLKPFALDTAMLAYQEFNADAVSVTASLREQEIKEKKEQQKVLEVLVGEEQKEQIDELSEKLSPVEFYQAFIQRCDEYVQTYTKKEKCEGKEDFCYIPTSGDDYKKGPDGEYLTRKNGERFIDYNKIYSLRECFWINNADFRIEELVAFFVSKGYTKNYDKLSREILGYSCAKYTQQLVDELIRNGNLCVEDVKIESNKLKEIKYSFRADYVKGNFYVKLENIIGNISISDTTEKETELSKNIKEYFGAESGNVIISNQRKILEDEANKPLVYRLDDEKKDAIRKLELSADSFLIWQKFKCSANYMPDSDNPRMKFVGENEVFYQFYKWLNTSEAKSEAMLAEYKDNIQELFDACIVPDNTSKYTVNWVMPGWTVRNANGDSVLHPIVLPKYQSWGVYRGSIISKGYKKIDFSATSFKGLRMWDGDSHYVKDQNPAYGEMVTLMYENSKYGNRSTGHQYFRYHNDPKDRDSINQGMSDVDKQGAKQAREDWEDTCRKLIESSKSVLARRMSKARRVCNEMFNYWVKNFAPQDLRNKIQHAWNLKYNSLTLPKFEKYPIFVRHSRYFGENKEFTLADAQREGVKSYVSRDNSVVLGHELGFGKTSSSIAAITHLFETGEASRILLTVENNTFVKWKREMIGNEDFIGFNPTINVVELYNATESALQRIKKYSDEEKKVINKFKQTFSGKASPYEIAMSKRDGYDVEKDNVSVIEDILAQNIPDYKSYPGFLKLIEIITAIFKRILEQLQKQIDEANTKANKQIAILNDKDLSAKEYNDGKDKIEKKRDAQIAKARKEKNHKLTKTIRKTIERATPTFWDDFGTYLPKVMRPNSVILCIHEAFDKLRADEPSCVETYSIVEDFHHEFTNSKYTDAPTTNADRIAYIENFKEDEDLCAKNLKNKVDLDIFSLPVSLKKLNIDALVIDEIGNFNNIITSIRKRGIEKQKAKEPIEIRKLNTQEGTSKKRAVIQYYTSAHGSKRLGSLNCLAIARSIQENNRKAGKNNNTMLLSATPFTDDPIYQMASVFSILNYNRLLKCGISGVFDLMNNYACEEWKLDLTHKKEIGIFPGVDRYRNIAANSNLLHLFVNFKIRDAKIEAKRPKKYVLPDQHRSFVNIIKNCEDVNSYIEMNDYQKQAKDLVLQVLHGTKTREEVLGRGDNINVSENEHEKAIELGAEENIIEVNSMEEIYTLKVQQGQIVKLTEGDNHVFIELIGDAPTNPENWSEPRATIEHEDIVKEIDEEDEGEEEGEDIDMKEANIISSIDSGNVDKKEVSTARTIICMGADTNISISPYVANIVGVNLPPLFKIINNQRIPDAKNFIENSPKLLYIVNCIKSVIDFHVARGEKISGQIIYFNRMRFVYENVVYYPLELIRQYMVSENIGIGEDEIAIIKGSTNKDVKNAIAERFNNGDVKVLIGTAAIKQGIDLQRNTSVLYIAQADYVPSTLMQVEGRAWRQGNNFKNIRVVYVMSYGSLDAFQFSKVNQKIGQIKRMLESTVFDLNTTQFTMDYNKMKLELETDLNKRAELEYELIAQDANEVLIRHSSQLETYNKIKKNISTYLPKWEKFIGKLNIIQQACATHGFAEAKEAFLKGPALLKIKEKQKAEKEAKLQAERDKIHAENDVKQAVIDVDVKVEQDKIDTYKANIAAEIEKEEAKVKKLSPEKTWLVFSDKNKNIFLTSNKLDLANSALDFKSLPADVKAKLEAKNVLEDIVDATVKLIKLGDPELKWNSFSEANKKNFAKENTLPETVVTLPYSELPEEAKVKLGDKNVFQDTIEATIKDIKAAGKEILTNKGKEDDIISVINAQINEEQKKEQDAVTCTDDEVKDFIDGKYDTAEEKTPPTNLAGTPQEIWDKWTYTDRIERIRGKSGYDENLLLKVCTTAYDKLDVLTKNIVDEIISKQTGTDSGRSIWQDWTESNRGIFLAKYNYNQNFKSKYYDDLPDDIKKKLNISDKDEAKEVWTSWSALRREKFLSEKMLQQNQAILSYDELPLNVKADIKDYITKPDLFSYSKSWTIPTQFEYFELAASSPLEQIAGVCEEIKVFVRSKISTQEKYDSLSDENKKKWMLVISAFEVAGYKNGGDRSVLYKELYGKAPDWSQRTYPYFYGEFVDEVSSFNLNVSSTTDTRTDKGTIIRNYYQLLNGNINELDVKISEIQQAINKIRQDVGVPKERIAEIKEKLEQEKKKKTKQGAYDLHRQVEIFNQTNILLQRRND